ncbi:magnesium transporter NIPA-domain-containing protein [Chytriomyces sp. MP71]|nr:magnesium transporter NIPA-domain-containing protein [Chytriomyces sp. MP71]
MSNSTAGTPDSLQTPAWQSAVGIALALLSNAFIGASVVFRKRGLLDIIDKGHDIAKGSTAYLQSFYWWTGMILLAIGELSNFGAYAFSPAILVTPLGTLSVVVSTVLSNYFLREKLSFLGKTGCGLCILGVIMIVTHAPTAQTTDTIPSFVSNVIQPVFLTYTVIMSASLLVLIYYAEPKYALHTPFVYIAMSSCGGSYLVLSAQGVGSSIVTTARYYPNQNQFLSWPMYPLIIFMVMTVVFQIHYLNKALAAYSTAIIYPIHYVCFTGMTMISTAFLFREFPVSSVDAGGSIFEGFIVLVVGVILLYKNNIDAKAAMVDVTQVDNHVEDVNFDHPDLEEIVQHPPKKPTYLRQNYEDKSKVQDLGKKMHEGMIMKNCLPEYQS